MTKLTQSESVLNFIHAEGGIVTFVRKDEEGEDDGGYHLRRQEISRPMWSDFGNPDQITVTIRPGDHLNVEDDNDAQGETDA